ncbi:MAG: DUF167 domain-containing protein [Myxococcota bacterium]
MTSAGDLDLRTTRDGVALWIHVTPRARRPRVGGLHGDALRVAVAAAPVDGAANAACREALAGALDLPRRDVHIDPASRHRRKRVEIAGDAAALGARLRALARSGATD